MTIPDRILGALRRLVRAELSDPVIADGSPPVGPQWAVWRYTVASATDTAVSARAVSSRCPWPDLPHVPIYPGASGVRYQPAVGSEVGIAFADGDPRFPRIVWADQVVPVTMAIDASSLLTLAESLTRITSNATVVEVGTTSPQFVALAPGVQAMASALVTLCGTLTTFGNAADAFGIAPSGSAMATAATNTANTISAQTFPATKLKSE